jgi:hypothetical protein
MHILKDIIYMKAITINKFIRNTIMVIAVAGLLLGCTDKFEEFNSNPNGITEREINSSVDVNDLIVNNLQTAQKFIYVYQPAWVTQLQQNLMGDVYSGYMMSPTPFAGNSNNITYALVDNWNEQAFDPAYDNVMNPIATVEDSTANDPGKKDVYAMAKIIKVEAMHRLSDIFGPIIYTKYRIVNTDGSVDYDTQEEAYNAFFNDLTTAINILTPLAGTTSSANFKNADLVYDGSYSKWLKFANTLRLRLAIRVSKVSPSIAKTEGEAALANAGGLLVDNSDNFNVNIGTSTHPLNVINNEWADIRLGAPVSSFMNGYDDPRLPSYAKPATDAAVVGQYIGIRQGITIDAKTRYQNYSALATFPSEIQLMTAAEAWFLKAEAAVRGWAGAGTAQDNYETGIETSFTQYGVQSDFAAYVGDNTSVPQQYIDPKALTAGENDIKTGNANLSTITIKWDDAASESVKLERIITQKWIAMYPDGQEAWSEFRRTGFPKLWPNVVNLSGGKIPGFVKRVNLVASEYATNKKAVDRAVEKLGGVDTGGTPLWWDVD